MRQFKQYEVKDQAIFKTQLLHWVMKFDRICYLDSNKNAATGEAPFETQAHDLIVAAGSVSELNAGKAHFESLKSFYASTNDWIFGHLGYDLKNEIEQLDSKNPDRILFPTIHFFQPEFVFILRNSILQIGYLKNQHSEKDIDLICQQILSDQHKSTTSKPSVNVVQKISKEKYLDVVNKLKSHIHQGDIYEVNFCQEFYAENCLIDPIEIYIKLNTISQTPFAAFYRLGDKYLMSASPERFLKKAGNKIISQPIKGTIKRGKSQQEDEELKELLSNDAKEKSENVMIVDLVRNDLSKTAKSGSVRVEELWSIHSFLQVHQMISTISSELRSDVHFVDAIKNAFPMGSMTGAPKVKAMELIEKYESTKRGLYSGSVGYIIPGGNFDFNVVIRSILYNTKNQYLSFMVGSAITAKAVAEKEYDECLLKAKAMFEVLTSPPSPLQ